jgi:protein-tyrosine phosphatase
MQAAGYVDLHLHVLPAIDDGARSLDAAVEMVRGLADVGFRHLVATPHADDHRHPYGRERIEPLAAEVAQAVRAAGLPVDIGWGAEYAYGSRFIGDLRARTLITLGGSRYVLLELPEEYMPTTMSGTLFEIGAAGYYPVLAHPERCRPFQDDVERLLELAGGRALVQVSFRSLAGTFGRTVRKTAWRLVTEGAADLVATDCHSPRELGKIVRPVVDELRKRLSPDHLQRLMTGTPTRMLAAARPVPMDS